MKKCFILLCLVLLLALCVGCVSDSVHVSSEWESSQLTSVEESVDFDEMSSTNELEASVESTITVYSDIPTQSYVSQPYSSSTVSKYSVASKTPAASKPTTSKSEAAKPVTKKAVTDAVHETIKDPYDGYVYQYHIPQVNLSGNLADEVNQKMRADGNEWLNRAKQDQKNGSSIINGDYNYTWGSYNKVISVLVKGKYPNDSVEYHVYNVFSDTGKQASNTDLRQMYGLSQQQLTNLLVKKAGECFKTKYKGVNAEPFYSEQYNKTVATSNANQSDLFINQSGKLCSVTKIYSLAGADYYYHVLTLS